MLVDRRRFVAITFRTGPQPPSLPPVVVDLLALLYALGIARPVVGCDEIDDGLDNALLALVRRKAVRRAADFRGEQAVQLFARGHEDVRRVDPFRRIGDEDQVERVFADLVLHILGHGVKPHPLIVAQVELLRNDKRSIALDREARDAEYALYERAQLTLYNAKGQLLRGPTMLEQRRLVVNDPDNPVGEETESSIVRAEMREQLSIRLAQQLEYWSRLLDQDSVNAPAP